MSIRLVWLLSLFWALARVTPAAALFSQDTLYDYTNRTLYIHLFDQNDDDGGDGDSTDKIFRLPFNDQYESGADISNSIIESPPAKQCKLIIANSFLYSFCPDIDEIETNVFKYTHSLDSWNQLNLNSSIPYYEDSNYIYTDSDKSGIYIFSGLMANSSIISDRMIRLDLLTLTTSDASTRIQPSPFYDSSALQINENTQALFGGAIKNDTLLNMMEIPLWQYNSWAERPCISNSVRGIDSRIGALMLPIFDLYNAYVLNETTTSFQVSSVLMVGGIDQTGINAYPQIASLNVSANVWIWNDLTNLVSESNSAAGNSQQLNLDNSVAAGTIYNTLITIEDPSLSSNHGNYTINLFNATSFQFLPHVDYTYLKNVETLKISSHTNKNTIIAISVIIPILMFVILSCLVYWLMRRYRMKKEEEMNEREIKEIVDFYENRHKQHSDLTFSTSDSDYKSSNSENPFGSESDVKINDYEDDDNLSISSWRRKRRDFENQQKLFGANSNLALVPRKNSITNPLVRTLSVASNFLTGQLTRKSSTQSSIATFITARTTAQESSVVVDNDNDTGSINSLNSASQEEPAPPPPAVPRHSTLVTHSQKANQLLNYIPENDSVSTFHSEGLGSIPIEKAESNLKSTQTQYMMQLYRPVSKRESLSSFGSISSSNAGSSVYPVSTLASPKKSVSRSTVRSPHRSSKRPSSMISSSSASSIRSSRRYSYTQSNRNTYYSDISPLTEHDGEENATDSGSITGTDMSNMEVQVLVSCKRRSKLRVVNPDDISNLDNESDGNGLIDTQHELPDEEGVRCTSTSSSDGGDVNNVTQGHVRKRVISDEHQHHDESFCEL